MTHLRVRHLYRETSATWKGVVVRHEDHFTQRFFVWLDYTHVQVFVGDSKILCFENVSDRYSRSWDSLKQEFKKYNVHVTESDLEELALIGERSGQEKT